MEVNEKIRKLTNRAKIAGELLSLSEKKEGVTKNGVPYVSFGGEVACDEAGIVKIKFKTFETAKNRNGDNENYKNVIKWYDEACSKEMRIKEAEEKNLEEPLPATMVTIAGSLTDNLFVNRENKLIEGFQYNLKYFSPFKEYLAQVDIEGYIYSIVDEVEGEEETPTGRMRMRLISMDGFGNVMSLNSLVIPSDLVDSLDEVGWENGATVSVAIDVLPSSRPKTVKTSGFGKQHTVDGPIYSELVVVGGENACDPDGERAITSAQVKAMLAERKNKIDTTVAEGYLGNSTTTSNRTGFGAKKAPQKDDFVVDDEDIPF